MLIAANPHQTSRRRAGQASESINRAATPQEKLQLATDSVELVGANPWRGLAERALQSPTLQPESKAEVVRESLEEVAMGTRSMPRAAEQILSGCYNTAQDRLEVARLAVDATDSAASRLGSQLLQSDLLPHDAVRLARVALQEAGAAHPAPALFVRELGYRAHDSHRREVLSEGLTWLGEQKPALATATNLALEAAAQAPSELIAERFLGAAASALAELKPRQNATLAVAGKMLSTAGYESNMGGLLHAPHAVEGCQKVLKLLAEREPSSQANSVLTEMEQRRQDAGPLAFLKLTPNERQLWVAHTAAHRLT